jgi:hypothetical protein
MMRSGATLRDLNMRVSGAIFRAEHAAPNSLEADRAYREVSRLEEQIASLVPPDRVQGAVARVGAVTAALSTKDWLRAAQLAETFMGDAPDDLAEQLRELANEAETLSESVAEPAVRPVSANLAA